MSLAIPLRHSLLRAAVLGGRVTLIRSPAAFSRSLRLNLAYSGYGLAVQARRT
jgi:hypothetical protein